MPATLRRARSLAALLAIHLPLYHAAEATQEKIMAAATLAEAHA